jgi:hypothetical protein
MEKYTGINTGKICKTEIVETNDINQMVIEADQHLCHIGLKAGASWEDIVHTPESAQFEASDHGDDDGSKPAKQMVITFEVPKLTAARIAAIHGRQIKHLVCRFTNTEGTAFVIGTTKSPALLTFNYGIGSKAGDGNTMKISLTAYSTIGLLQEVQS